MLEAMYYGPVCPFWKTCLYCFYIFFINNSILVIQINIFQFNSIQFNLLALLVCTPSPVEIAISSDCLFALVLDYLSKVV